MASVIDDIKNVNKILLFFFLVLITALLVLLNSILLFTDDLYYNHFGEQMSYDQIRSFLDLQYKFQWIAYLALPIILLLKISILSIVLLAGSFFWNVNISFKRLFQIALIAEFIFIIPSLIKLGWFLLIKKDYELIDLQTFYPMSLVNLVNIGDVPIWLYYPLQTVNIFEVVYWCVLAYGLALVTMERWHKMVRLVASSYGVGLLVWLVFITFITINFA
jgi:hypothetical protein